MQFTLQCGDDSQTYALYINGHWVVNITLAAVPVLYRYEILMPNQAQWFTTYFR